jgi:hypothetical protein
VSRRPSDGFPVVTTADGTSWSILPTSARVRWTEASARAVLVEALADASARDAVLELAAQLGASVGDEEDAIRTLARALLDGSLLAFEEPERPTGRPITGRRPKVDPPVRPKPTVTPGWVSFELVDHQGAALGDRALTFEHADGHLDSVTLDSCGRSPRISTTSTGSIYIEWPKKLSAELGAPKIAHFTARPDDLHVARAPKGMTRLGVGRHWRIVVDPPPPPVVGITAAGFGIDSSFPTPAILVPLLGVAFAEAFADFGLDWLGSTPRTLQVFGHAESDGEIEHNKALSDRRAQVFAALLTGDVVTVQSIAKTEGWGTREYQAILRVLRCDPGAIDGELGALTTRAVRLFQAEYRDGVFHRHCAEDCAPRNPGLEPSGEIDPPTADALVEALVVATSPRLPPERLHPTLPTAGCSELNRRRDQPAPADRRLTIVAHDRLPVWDEPPPCRRGDHNACAVDGADPVVQCKWYRENIAEAPEDLPHRHFDLRWLALPSGKLLLGALTTVPDGGEVTFDGFWSIPIAGLDDLSESTLGDPMFGPKIGLVRAGVAQLVWDPPPGLDLFDTDRWLVASTSARPADLWANPQRARVPVFRVRGGGATAISPPPGDDVARLASEQATRGTDQPLHDVHALDAFGRIVGESLSNGRAGGPRHSLAPDETRVVAVRFAAGYLRPDDEVTP